MPAQIKKPLIPDRSTKGTLTQTPELFLNIYNAMIMDIQKCSKLGKTVV